MHQFQFTQDMWDRFTAKNIIKQNPHIAEEHVGKSKEYIRERANRMRHNAATFLSVESLDYASEAFLCSGIIERQIRRDMFFDDEFEYEVKCDDFIGMVAERNGKIYNVKRCRFVCRFYKSAIYRNEHTGMPFDITTIYPVRVNEQLNKGAEIKRQGR